MFFSLRGCIIYNVHLDLTTSPSPAPNEITLILKNLQPTNITSHSKSESQHSPVLCRIEIDCQFKLMFNYTTMKDQRIVWWGIRRMNTKLFLAHVVNKNIHTSWTFLNKRRCYFVVVCGSLHLSRKKKNTIWELEGSPPEDV